MCSVKLDRAQKLIGGLGGERDRWSATAESLETAYGALTGDALVAATTMSYFGAFTASFRQRSIDVISHAIRMPSPSPLLHIVSCGKAWSLEFNRIKNKLRDVFLT